MKRFWQRESFWLKYEKAKPYIAVGLTALKIGLMFYAPSGVVYEDVSNELFNAAMAICKAAIDAGVQINFARCQNYDTDEQRMLFDIMEFAKWLVYDRHLDEHGVHLVDKKDIETAVEFFLNEGYPPSDATWLDNQDKCQLVGGTGPLTRTGTICEGIFIPRGMLFYPSGSSLEERNEITWKYVREQQAKYAEMDRLEDERDGALSPPTTTTTTKRVCCNEPPVKKICCRSS